MTPILQMGAKALKRYGIVSVEHSKGTGFLNSPADHSACRSKIRKQGSFPKAVNKFFKQHKSCILSDQESMSINSFFFFFF